MCIDDDLTRAFELYDDLYNSKMWKPEGHITSDGAYVNNLRDWMQNTVDEPHESEPGMTCVCVLQSFI